MSLENNEKKWIILFIILVVTFMSTLDGSIVNVALPVMTKVLNVDSASIQLVVISYLMVISATILIFGRLGDMFGKIKVFKIGLLIFTLGSLLCGLTNSLLILVIARVIQAIGAAACMANNQGIITEIFPINERGRALGLSGTFVALGSLVGPPLGGLILSISSWQYIFLINVPIGIIALFYTIRLLPKENKKTEAKLDGVGAILFMLAITLLFGALNYGQNIGFDKPIVLMEIFIAFISLIAFVYVEKKQEHPLLQIDIFKNKLFTVSIICAFISFVAIFCSNIILPFYLQYVKGFSPAQAGVILMVYPLILSIVAPISGHLSDKIGSEFLTFIGLILTSLGLFLMSLTNEATSTYLLIIFIGIMSLGNGMFQSPNNSLVMSQVPKNKLGVAGSINGLVRNLGMICGIAFSTILLYNRMSYKIGYHVTDYVNNRSDIFIYGMHIVYTWAGIICMIGAALTAFRLLRKKNETPRGL